MASTSPLLRLPAELRNTIYELTLTASRSLHHHKPDAAGKKPYFYLRDDKSPVDYNQLKYANKQLYAETAGLELKFNDITFSEGSKDALPSDALIDWVSSVSITKRSWIKTISIRPDSVDDLNLIGESPDAVARLTQLCNGIPNVKVKYYKPSWVYQSDFGIGFFFTLAQCFSYAFRGKIFKYLFNVAVDQDMAIIYATRWRKGHHYKSPKVELVRLQAENLKYFPIMPTDTPVPVIKADYTIARDDEVIPEAEQWIGNKYLREWMEHGI
ncbi:hypothetical protein J4E93_008831 [Alternaria ventricosa]|uniref:uncharacterized protein n=1 Tax=Alternaria ventricosa TaxID=1187951 RepID=UPI0020C5A344|nr:uncharacterized protein J4E93_008831 [Alternaria ventricosa]KAI4640031.1 hypothetical protein J4E93_008831 [Alternaria ventricosa]